MTTDAAHLEMQELLAGAACGILETAEAESVAGHLTGCVRCPELLGHDLLTVAELDLIIDPARLTPARSALLRADLASRAAADRRSTGQAPRRRGALLGQWTGWLVAASLVGVLFAHHGFHRPVSSGWIAAGACVIIAVAAVADAAIQRARVRALRDRIGEDGGPE